MGRRSGFMSVAVEGRGKRMMQVVVPVMIQEIMRDAHEPLPQRAHQSNG